MKSPSERGRNLILVVIFFIVALLAICGCTTATTTVQSSAPSGTIYKYTLSINVNGVDYNGVAVVPHASSYDMKILSSVDVDMLQISSCHRDLDVPSAIELGWFQKNKGYHYLYYPTSLETVDSCLVHLGAYNQGSKTKNAWGLIDFEDPSRAMGAMVECNGQAFTSNGVSICQALAGTLQMIHFSTPMELDDKLVGACRPTTSNNMDYLITVSAGECVIEFIEVAQPHALHRHTTVGYNQPIIGE